MHFEHLVQINDPLFPLLEPLSRVQVWRGLVLRMADPVQFLPGLVGCEIGERVTSGGTITFSRHMDFGRFQVRDHVTLETLKRIEVIAEGSDSWPAARMQIEIEEPCEETLNVRFTYEIADKPDRDGLTDLTRQARQKAYELSDIDTIRRIRELATTGELN